MQLRKGGAYRLIWQGTLTSIFEFHHRLHEPVSVDGVLWTQSGTSETRMGGTYKRERVVHTRARIDSFFCGLTSLSPNQASPAQLLAWIRAHWHIENRCHWRRDATLGEDACTVRHTLVATILGVLNSLILALFDYRKVSNARAAIRTFAAYPEQALALLTKPL